MLIKYVLNRLTPRYAQKARYCRIVTIEKYVLNKILNDK